MKIEKISLDKVKDYLDFVYGMYNCIKDYKFLEEKEIYLIKGEYFTIEIIDNNNKIDNLISELGNINLIPYSIGEPILVVTKKGEIRPLLPLSRYLINICKNKIIVNEKLAEILTYGKPIVVKENYEPNYYLILDENNNFIAYGRVIKEKNKTKIIPELDIGWYLRKGG